MCVFIVVISYEIVCIPIGFFMWYDSVDVVDVLVCMGKKLVLKMVLDRAKNW